MQNEEWLSVRQNATSWNNKHPTINEAIFSLEIWFSVRTLVEVLTICCNNMYFSLEVWLCLCADCPIHKPSRTGRVLEHWWTWTHRLGRWRELNHWIKALSSVATETQTVVCRLNVCQMFIIVTNRSWTHMTGGCMEHVGMKGLRFLPELWGSILSEPF